jgi:hypothetical protein
MGNYFLSWTLFKLEPTKCVCMFDLCPQVAKCLVLVLVRIIHDELKKVTSNSKPHERLVRFVDILLL